MGNNRRPKLVVEETGVSPLTWAEFYWFLFEELDGRRTWKEAIKDTDEFWIKFRPICKEGVW